MCFIIAGDVVFNMAHTEYRPEKSTGKMVRGSDLDIVIVHHDDLDPELIAEFDSLLYKRKYLMLAHPILQEELDYIIKPFSMVERQVGFDTFKHMVACKILDEGEFLLGNETMFNRIKDLLDEHEIPERIGELTTGARKRRLEAEKILQAQPEKVHTPEFDRLFFYREESDEIF